MTFFKYTPNENENFKGKEKEEEKEILISKGVAESSLPLKNL